jgi:predicted secreted protein
MAGNTGKALKVKIDDTAAVALRSKELNYTAEMADATTQDSTGDWKEFVPLQKEGTVSMEGLYNPDAGSEGLDDFITKLKNGTKCTVYFGGIETGDTYEECDGYIADITWSGDYGDLQNVSVEIQLTGEPETKTVT